MQGQRGMSRACSTLRHILSSEQKNKPSLNGKERDHTDADEQVLCDAVLKVLICSSTFLFLEGRSEEDC